MKWWPVLLLSGCVSSGALGPLPTVNGDAAEIVVIRDTRFVAAGATIIVALDGSPVFGLDGGEHVILKVAPGEHHIGKGARLGTSDRFVMVDVKAGRRYYVQLQPTLEAGVVPTPLAPQQGEALMAQTKRVGP